MSLIRRGVLAASLLSLAALGHAQDGGAIKMIVPFGPGTTLMEQGVQGINQRAMRTEEMLPFNKTELVKWAERMQRSGAQVD